MWDRGYVIIMLYVRQARVHHRFRIPGTAGNIYKYMRIMRKTVYYSFIKLILVPDVCYIRPRLLVVCSGHLHISVSPPSLGMIPWTVIM